MKPSRGSKLDANRQRENSKTNLFIAVASVKQQFNTVGNTNNGLSRKKEKIKNVDCLRNALIGLIVCFACISSKKNTN